MRTNEKDARVWGRNGNELKEELEEKIVIVSPIVIAKQLILGDLARVVSRGGGLHPINRKRSCERAAEDVARFRGGRSHG